MSEDQLNEPYQASYDSEDIEHNQAAALDDIFNQNEVQVRAMLEEAVKSKRQKDQEEAIISVSTPRTEINDK